MKRLCLSVLLLLTAPAVFGEQPTSRPGQQIMVAYRTHWPVTLDGKIGLFEWSAAMPVCLAAVHPGQAPGVIPKVPDFPYIAVPDSQADLRYTVRTMYDDDSLYVAVEVTDDRLVAVHTYPYLWQDDDVEVMIDGDRQPGDFDRGVFQGVRNQEGFQLITSVGGGEQTEPRDNPGLENGWKSAVAILPHGYSVEFRVPLAMINTEDTSDWSGGTAGRFRRLQPGDTIGFNVAVGDNDTGEGSYLVPGGARTSSYLAWDGSSLKWSVWREEDWGRLYLAEPGECVRRLWW